MSSVNLHPKKKLGQNFLKDSQTSEMIIDRCNLTAADTILEIGAGLGAMTIPAARRVKKVYAVEMDQRIYGLLNSELLLNDTSNVQVVQGNILTLPIKDFAEKAGRKIILLGNLPYNISSQILVKLIHERVYVDCAIIMLQKEMGIRITAVPGSRDYGRLSVMLKYCADIRRIANLKATCFFPKPKIDSVVVEIKFRDSPREQADDEAFFFKTIKAAFSKRRKVLKNSLSGNILNIDSQTAERLLKKADIDPVRRAETLTVSDFVRLSNSIGREK